MDKRLFLIINIIFLGRSIVLSQAPFAKTYGGNGFEEATAIAATPAGDYLICGNTSSFAFDSTGASVYILKVDSAGNPVFSRSYGGSPGYDIPTAICATFDGGIAIGGMTWNFGAGDADIFLLRTDSIGELQWMRVLGSITREKAFAIVQTVDSGFAITGFTKYDPTFPGVDDKILLIKTDKFGELQWYKTFGGALNEQATSIIQTDDGGFVLSGYTQSYGAGQNEVCILRTDSVGAIEWAKSFGTSLSEVANDIVQTPDNGFIFTGTSEDCGFGGGDILVVKLDSGGNIIWSNCIGSPALESVSRIALAPNGNLMMAGLTIIGGYDVLFLSIDTQGNVLTSAAFGGDEEEAAADLVVSGDSAVIIAGYSSIGLQPFDMLVLRLSSTFEAGCSSTSLALNILPVALSVTDSMQVFSKDYVEQLSTPTEYLTNTATRDFCTLISIAPIETQVVRAFPNPFDDFIKFFAEKRTLKCTLFDAWGRKIVEERFQQEMLIDAGNYPAGFYFYQVTDDKQLVEKGTLIKR